MSAWDPNRDLARLLAALGQELVASDLPEVQAACFRDGDSVHTAARNVRELIGPLVDDPDESGTGGGVIELTAAAAHWARQH